MTQRQLAQDLRICQNYVPAIEANTSQAGPKVQQQMMTFSACSFNDLFEVILVDPEVNTKRVLEPRTRRGPQ